MIQATGIGPTRAAPPPPPPPPPPPLSAVQQGDVAAGRLRLVEGQAFSVGDPSAPAVATWADQPPTSAYRQAFDAAAARLGTTDRAAVTAEIGRQLYGEAAPSPVAGTSGQGPVPASAPVSAFAGVTATGSAQVERDGEGIGSFLDGAFKGDFGDNDSWSSLAGQSVVGFIPIVGQVADLRDTASAVGRVFRGEEGGWAALGMAGVAWVPGVGDLVKNGLRGADKIADAGSDVVRRGADDAAEGATDAGARLTRDVDPVTGRVTIRGEGGEKGEWPPELNARRLEANADYHINGYHYATDAQGRVNSVEGRLDLSPADRNGYQQQVSGRADRLPDDQGGHLIASIFNGPGDRLNLVPMNGNFNMGAWRSMEAGFETALKEGKQVDVRVDVIYAEGTQRPAKFVVQSVVDGKAETLTFRNRPGG
ncbi:hypothetical protein ASG29_07205 [Sphingomonas sp. Leaf412]|uniref:DNA/RNA non-specific endonuclease n=1 Tax=Sphingomonas sp. Leaf412 TaxID=1736370 RepID=UPI0006FB75F9|nr:DNA/RNA non-specific endonuclease [Sphingomonas sp. Leaf412]KQT31710.1 hypothetical protein ASG29_07205 [Sphingomonas sp. Leaf412]